MGYYIDALFGEEHRFFVQAKSEEEARKRVERFVREELGLPEELPLELVRHSSSDRIDWEV